MNTYVLICCHNGEKYIEDQINSILTQAHSITAIVIHDFNSKDNTLNIINSISTEKPGLINVIHHQDAPGASLSFFRAISLIAREINNDDCIFFADQDDVWLPSKVERVRKEFERLMASTTSGHVAVFHDVKVVDEKLFELRPTYYTGNPFSIPRDLAPDRLLLANPVIGHTMAVSGRLLRKVASVRNPSAYLMHDWAMVLFASRLGAIGFIPIALSLYRQHSSNVLGAYGRRRFHNIIGRILRFSDSVCQQARAFGKDLGDSSDGNTLIHRITSSSRAVGYAWLSVSALLNGPTYQRKLLSLFIGWHSLVYALTKRD